MEIGIIGRSEHTYETMLLLKENGFSISFIVTSKESKEHKENFEKKIVPEKRKSIKSEVKKNTSVKVKDEAVTETKESSNTIEWDLTSEEPKESKANSKSNKSDDDEQMKLF